MNERIRELAKQADLDWHKHWNVTDEESNRLEKFAKLMIQEFETVAKNPRWYFPDQQDGWRDPINCICKEMKKHFGVKYRYSDAEPPAPPQRKPLTDEQIAEIAATPAAIPGSYVHSFARAIEAAHGIKGEA